MKARNSSRSIIRMPDMKNQRLNVKHQNSHQRILPVKTKTNTSNKTNNESQDKPTDPEKLRRLELNRKALLMRDFHDQSRGKGILPLKRLKGFNKTRNRMRENTFKSNNTSKMIKRKNINNGDVQTFKTDDENDNLDSFDSHSSALQDSIVTEEIDEQEEFKSVKESSEDNKPNKVFVTKATLKDQKISNIKMLPKKKVENSGPKRIKVDLKFAKKETRNYANYKNEGSAYSHMIRRDSTQLFS